MKEYFYLAIIGLIGLLIFLPFAAQESAQHFDEEAANVFELFQD